MCFFHDLLAVNLAVSLAVGLAVRVAVRVVVVRVVVEFSAAIRFLAIRIWLPSDYAVFFGNQNLVIWSGSPTQPDWSGRVGNLNPKPDQTVSLDVTINTEVA